MDHGTSDPCRRRLDSPPVTRATMTCGILRQNLSCSFMAMAALAAAPALAQTRDILPVPEAPFAGHAGQTLAQSRPAWPAQKKAPAGAPNVIVIMTDDAGFAASSAFGGPVPTPNLEKLAARGLKYNQFHTTAICSPSRASLLTGRNHHAVGTGSVIEMADGFPGYNSIIPKSATTMGQVMKDNGYNTAYIGKHHNIPMWELSQAGPFDHWPVGLGFEYFYGFVGPDIDQFHPKLYRNTSLVADQTRDTKETLDHELVDDTIHWIHQQKAAGPDKPFFIYFTPGTTHAPHQAPREWIDRFKGKFDQGWDKMREEIFARQKSMNVIPASTVLTPRPAEIPAWDSRSPERKKIDARFMEVYAGMLAYEDAQFGRLFDELERMGQLDNTMIVLILGDNGASGEGGPEGSANEMEAMAIGVGKHPPVNVNELGGPRSFPIYPVGWAWALNTPFQWTKQIASHLGGLRDGMVISWPNRIKQFGQTRSQFGHVVDIAPTVYEAIGITPPSVVNGVPQKAIDGTSLVYSFDQANAPNQHKIQYFEVMGNRAIYSNGWFANTVPKRMPWQFTKLDGNPVTDYTWQLYNLNNDFSQSKDLAAEQPEKLKELQALFDKEALRNDVYPLNDSMGKDRAQPSRTRFGTRLTSFEYWGKGIDVAQMQAPSFAARSFSIDASIVVPEKATGAIVANGSWYGGWAFYLKDGRLTALQALSHRPEDQHYVRSTMVLKPGPASVRFVFEYDGGGMQKGGTMKIFIDGKPAGEGRMASTILTPAASAETFDIGQDTGVPVSDEYASRGLFPGEIKKVEVTLAPLNGNAPTPRVAD